MSSNIKQPWTMMYSIKYYLGFSLWVWMKNFLINGRNEELTLFYNFLDDTAYCRGYTVQDGYKLSDVLESV